MIKNLYFVDITIHNHIGELVDTRFAFTSLDEARNIDVDKLVNQAEDYAKENNMLLEELFDSEEEAEFNKEDGN